MKIEKGLRRIGQRERVCDEIHEGANLGSERRNDDEKEREGGGEYLQIGGRGRGRI